MIPANLDVIPTVVQGDTWAGLGAFRVWDRDPATQGKVTPTSPVVSCSLRFAKTLDQSYADLALSNPSGIIIADAAEWRFEVGASVLSLTHGEYQVCFQTTDAAGVKRTWWVGKMRVLQPVPAASS